MEAPIALRIYAGTVVVSVVVVFATGELWDSPVAWIAVLIILGLLWALLRGSRAAWVLFVAVEASVWISTPFDRPAWWAMLVSAIALICLLAPTSRRFVWRRPDRASRQRELPHTGEPWGSVERR